MYYVMLHYLIPTVFSHSFLYSFCYLSVLFCSLTYLFFFFFFFFFILVYFIFFFFFFSSRRRHTRFDCDWSSDVCSSDLAPRAEGGGPHGGPIYAGPPRRLRAAQLGLLSSSNRSSSLVSTNRKRSSRSEERRVGKECRSRRSPLDEKKQESEDKREQWRRE